MDLGQTLRVVLPRLHLVAHGTCHVGELDRHGRHPFSIGAQSLSTTEQLRGAAEQIHRSPVVRRTPGTVAALEKRNGGRGRLTVGRCVGQALLLESQRNLLVGVVESGRFDLGQLVPQDIGFPGPLLRIASERPQRLVERGELAP